jgi:hypothetical protein
LSVAFHGFEKQGFEAVTGALPAELGDGDTDADGDAPTSLVSRPVTVITPSGLVES